MPPAPGPDPVRPRLPDRLALLLARGFGSGLAPKGPGTFGSLVGLVWLALLLLPGSVWLFDLGLLASLPVAVWACDRAETVLGRHDPGCIVLDEIVAVPLCFAAPLYLAMFATQGGGFPSLADLGTRFPAWFIPAGFVAFRFFDIAKPWPVRQVQSLPGGLGIVTDDLLAAAWVNIVLVVGLKIVA